jgi:hypothetical protein
MRSNVDKAPVHEVGKFRFRIQFQSVALECHDWRLGQGVQDAPTMGGFA